MPRFIFFFVLGCLLFCDGHAQKTRVPRQGPASDKGKDSLLPWKANPLSYISIPFQHNFDINVPPNNGFRWTMNLMPIIPLNLSEQIALISRVVLPVVSQKNIIGESSQTGLGDLLINTFISPRVGKVVWGIGPSFYFPTGTSDYLSSKKWAAGPGITFAAQTRKLTAALLVFHLWSFAGSSGRRDFSYTWFQPFFIYHLPHRWGIGLTAEIGQEWNRGVTNGALILTGQKTVRIGKQVFIFVLGPKLFFGNFNAPEAGFRTTVNLLYP